MFRFIVFAISVCVVSTSFADEKETNPLEMVVKGWSLGNWAELNHVFLDKDTREWSEVKASPWSNWDVEALSATLVEVSMSDGSSHRVEIIDGEYRDFGDVDENGEVGEPFVIPIVETTVRSPQDWRILLQWPKAEDSESDEQQNIQYSELSIAGDMFFWANWVGTSPQDMFRVSMSVSQVKRD